jgi:hypothetical protein
VLRLDSFKRIVVLAALATSVGLLSRDAQSARTAEPYTSAAEVEAALCLTPVAIGFKQVAETLAIRGKHTEVQPEMLKTRLRSHVVLWQLMVHEVKRNGDADVVTSQPVNGSYQGAYKRVRVVAMVSPRSNADVAWLQSATTGSDISVSGQVQASPLRSIVAMSRSHIDSGPTTEGLRP